ncbi:glycosyltransferase family 4 protein [Sphingomonas sp.]|uniref:glycosyltransferase family 4 protein n=1 Tax=Sphingomonas sp. TaxID=28214 RepID=UPI00182D96C0|nr:glycosyltransferase family 4 protein [Sphingomonas sp.]MBA3511527.1 glycosyltransferase family 4 protein [Sphingomonas sp.]
MNDIISKQAKISTSEAIDRPQPKLLVLDAGYTLEGIRERRIEQSVTCRDLDGFFAHVWSVHPFATLVTSESWGPRHGRPQLYQLAPRHSIIEGKVGRHAWLSRLFAANFLLSQIDLFLMLWRLIRKEGISVIRAASPLYPGLFGWALARLSGIPLVIRVGGNHDKYYETTGQPIEPRLMRSRRIEKIVERFVFSRADLVAAANQDNLDFALANGARAERSTLFRYGNLIDDRHFVEPGRRSRDDAYLAELGISPGKFLLYIGRLEPVKQPDHVVETLVEVRRRGFDVKAVLAGEGRMREQLAERAHAAGIEDSLIFAGNVGQDRLAQLMPLAAAIVSPHTGRALTEAALGAAPVVAYDVDWQGELIETGVTGILVPHGEVEQMAQGTVRLLSDPAYARQLGDSLRKRALEMLDPLALDEHERQEYSKLLTRFDRPE